MKHQVRRGVSGFCQNNVRLFFETPAAVPLLSIMDGGTGLALC